MTILTGRTAFGCWVARLNIQNKLAFLLHGHFTFWFTGWKHTVNAPLIHAVQEQGKKSMQLFAFHHIEWRRKSHTMHHWPADVNGVNKRLSKNLSIYSACQWHKHLAVWACRSPGKTGGIFFLAFGYWLGTTKEVNKGILSSLHIGYPESHVMFWTEKQMERERKWYLIVFCWPFNRSVNFRDLDEGFALFKNPKKAAAPCAQRGPEDTSGLWHFG